MKKLIILLMLGFLTSSCFAGGMGQRKEVLPVKPYIGPGSVWGETDADPKPVTIVEKNTIIREVYEKPEPVIGLGIGFHNRIPTVSYDFGLFDVEAGAISIAGDRYGVIKGGLRFYESQDKYTKMRVGAAYFPGTTPEYGIYGEVEQNISATVSILGCVYPARAGGQQNYLEAAIGGRLKI